MDQLAYFLAGSLLFGLGVVILGIMVLVLNNLFYTYWKPVKWLKYEYHPVYFDGATGSPLEEKKDLDGKSK